MPPPAFVDGAGGAITLVHGVILEALVAYGLAAASHAGAQAVPSLLEGKISTRVTILGSM
jgi:hypothetical protein